MFVPAKLFSFIKNNSFNFHFQGFFPIDRYCSEDIETKILLFLLKLIPTRHYRQKQMKKKIRPFNFVHFCLSNYRKVLPISQLIRNPIFFFYCGLHLFTFRVTLFCQKNFKKNCSSRFLTGRLSK